MFAVVICATLPLPGRPPGRVRRPVQRRRRRLLGCSLLAPSSQASGCSVTFVLSTFVRLGDLDAGNLLDRPPGRRVAPSRREAMLFVG